MVILTTTIIDFVYENEESAEERQWLREKIPDMEDHSRHNNFKLQGVPESALSPELKQYATDMFRTLTPDILPIELSIDHIHRIPKPAFLPNTVPRDVLLRVHFCSTKDQILRKSRTLGKLPEPYENIHIYADLCKFTMDLKTSIKYHN